MYGSYNDDSKGRTKEELVSIIKDNNITLSTNEKDPCNIDKLPIKTLANVVNNLENGNYIGDMLKVKTEKIDNIDILIGGFPCQSVSNAGKGEGIIKGETRSGLMYDMLEFAILNKPKIVIAENVKGILSPKHKPQLDEYITTLSNEGYSVNYKVLRATDFGLPQGRERVFIIATLGEEFSFDNLEETEMRILRDFLETDNVEQYKVTQPSMIKAIEDDKMKLLDISNDNEYCGTITTKQSRWNVSLVPIGSEWRNLTPRECWRLMGYEDADFDKAGLVTTKNNLYRQAGNSICVDVMQEVMKECCRILGD